MDTIGAVPLNLSDLIFVHSMFQLLYGDSDEFDKHQLEQLLWIIQNW